MSEAATATRTQSAPEAAPDGGQSRVSELRASAHLMSLDAGLFCVFQAAGSPSVNPQSGLPGVRITLPPGAAGRSDAVSISTFQADGWISGQDSAALVRVSKGPAQVLVTVYQAPSASPENAPRLQVMRLGGEPTAGPAASAARPAQATVPLLSAEEADVVAHVQRTGDVPAKFGEWVGTRGSQLWIEGFSVTPHDTVKPSDVEYQAVLGRGWLSPWIEGGKFCGSRGMALPLLGLKVRLKGAAAKSHECSYAATFVDGSSAGPVPAGETCEAESLAALESFQITIRRAAAAAETAPRGGRARAAEPAAPATKPAVTRPATPKPPGGAAKRPSPRAR
jgi:hypothetical protein